jgi:facilitated trehalose transporter
MNSEEKELVNDKQNIRVFKIENPESNKVKCRYLIPQVIASCVMYLLVIQAGINMSYASILISQLNDESDIPIDTDSSSNISSIWAISLCFGGLTSGFLMDKFGRKKLALFTSVLFLLIWISTALAKSLSILYIARTLAGICCGLTTASVVYAAEISDKKIRSSMLCMNSLWVSFGIFLTYLLNYLNFKWQSIAWIYSVMTVLSFFLILIVPESPHWIIFFNKSSSEEKKLIELKKSLFWLNHKVICFLIIFLASQIFFIVFF